MRAYHAFLQAGAVCQGLLQYLSANFSDRVWNSFGSWLRTIRDGIPPSELVVASALRQCLPEFLLNATDDNKLAKFIRERQDNSRLRCSEWPHEGQYTPSRHEGLAQSYKDRL